MCYAFIDRLVKQRSLPFEVNHRLDSDRNVANPVTSDLEPNVTSHKRPADTTLDHQPTKVAKTSSKGDSASKPGVFEPTSETQTVPEEVANLKESLARATCRIKKLENVQQVLEGERDNLKYELLKYQVREEKRIETANAEENERQAFTKEMIKKAQASNKAESAKRFEDMKSKFQDKINSVRRACDDKIEALKSKQAADLAAKEDMHKKKMDEIKAKNQQLERATKDAKANHAKAEKELKAHHQKIQKEMRLEHQEQIKQWKPEHSKALKEKDTALKEKQKEISGLALARDKHEERAETLGKAVNEFRSKCERLEKDVTEKDIEIEGLQNYLSSRYEELNEIAQSHDDRIKRYQARLVRESERWQLQVNKAEKFAGDLIQQQRTNFVLRNGLDSRDKRIEELQTQLHTAKEMTEGSYASSMTALDASTQTEDSMTTTDERSEAKD